MTHDISAAAKTHPAPGIVIRESRFARNTVLNLMGLVLPAAVGLLTAPVVIHFFGTERFGIFSLLLVVFSYFSIFDFGLGRAATRFVAESMGRGDDATMPKYLWTSVALQFGVGIVSGGLLALMTPWLVHRIINIPLPHLAEARDSFYWLAISLPFVLTIPSFRGVLEAGQKFGLVNAIKIPTNALLYILPLVGVVLGTDLRGMIILLDISRVLTLAVWMKACFTTYPASRRRSFLPKGSLKPLLTFGGWNALSALIWPFLTVVDRFFIGAVLNVEAVGYFAAPSEMVMRLGLLTGSLSLTLFPAFSALAGGQDRDRILSLYRRTLKFSILVMGTAVVVIFFFAPLILRVWLGQNFADNGALVFQILAGGAFLAALANIPYNYLQGIGRADVTTKFQILELIVYLPLLWFLTKTWNIAGAALAGFVRIGLDMTLHFGAVRLLGRMPMSGLLRGENLRVLGILGGLGAALFAGLRLPLSPIWIGLTLGAFFYVCWFVALSDAERNGLTTGIRWMLLRRWISRLPNMFQKRRRRS